MAKRTSISATHTELLGVLSPILRYRFEAVGPNAGGFPGVEARVRIEDGEVVQDIPSISGGSIVYRTLGQGNATALTHGYVEVTTGSKAIRLRKGLVTTGTGPHNGTIFWRNINGTNNPIPGSVQGTYGQGSTEEFAEVTVPPNSTVTYTVRHSTSANNQVVNLGSFLEAVEL